MYAIKGYSPPYQRSAAAAASYRKAGMYKDNTGPSKAAQHEVCYAVHAEQNAIIPAAKLGVSLQDATIYCAPARSICAKMIINSGIQKSGFRPRVSRRFSMKMFAEAGLLVENTSLDLVIGYNI